MLASLETENPQEGLLRLRIWPVNLLLLDKEDALHTCNVYSEILVSMMRTENWMTAFKLSYGLFRTVVVSFV